MKFFFFLISVCVGSNSFIIFIPGYTQSTLYAKIEKDSFARQYCEDVPLDNFFLAYENENLQKNSPQCINAIGSRCFDLATNRIVPRAGTEIRAPTVGNLTAVKYVGETKSHLLPMIDYFAENGYTPGVDLRGFAYDFSEGSSDNQDYIDSLKKYIETTSERTGKKVVIISHSLGALVSIQLLNSVDQTWKDRHVGKFISMAGAYGGTIETVGVEILDDPKWKSSCPTSRQTPSVYWLFPNKDVYTNQIVVSRPHKNYTSSDLPELLEEIGAHVDAKILQLQKVNLSFPGVEVHCIYSYGVPTTNKFVYGSTGFPENPVSKEKGDGDSEVNIEGLEVCRRWKYGNNRVFYKTVYNVTHPNVPQDPEVLKYVLDVLS